MIWKKIKKIKYKKFSSCIKEFKKDYIMSHWIYDIAKQFKRYSFDQKKIYEIHKVSVKQLGFNKPTQLNQIYKALKIRGYLLIEPPLAIYLRCLYKNQPKGEWLRIAVPLNSMIDSDGVPHLPKLGSALGKLFIETYWSYPKAIFHPHNNFLVKKNDLSANKVK
jgi:hypothetical protein